MRAFLPLLLALLVGSLHCGDDAGNTSPGQPAAGQTGNAGNGEQNTGAGGQGKAGAGGSGGNQAGQGGQSGPGGAGGAGGACDVDGKTRTGEATYYTEADGSGNCGFPATPDDLRVGAMNQADYAGSAACGACAEIDGPQGSVTVRIVDRCPECKPGDIDLSPQAFEELAALQKGRVPITWRYVACPVQGNLVYHFKDGSNPWWTAVQIRNHRFPIAKVAYRTKDGSFKDIERLEYNYFVEPSGMGDGPYTFRVTDTRGNVIEDSGIPLKDNGDVASKAQFPGCGG
jgi:expansin (peptidoglycan-binding protein)